MEQIEKRKEYYLDVDGTRLHMKLDFPQIRREKMPVLIIQHGLTGHMEEEHLIKIARIANAAGFVTLRPELYGHGASEGAFCDHTIGIWVDELTAVIDHVQAMEFTSDIYLAGHSQGGLAVMLAAARRPKQIRALLPLSAAIVIVDGCRTGNFFGVLFDPDKIPEQLKAWEDKEKYVTGEYVRSARKIDVIAAAKAYHGPVLLVHGTQDEAVPYHYSVDAAEWYENVSLVTVEGDDHGYHKHLDQVLDAIDTFLRTQC